MSNRFYTNDTNLIGQLADQAHEYAYSVYTQRLVNERADQVYFYDIFNQKFAELIVQQCIDKIETYRIPVGNSASGELACEWTYSALKEIRDDIKEHFGVEE
jgi:hypothetical protein